MMSTGTYGLKLFARNNIFKRGNYKYEILNNLYFGPSFVFSRTTSGRFSQCVCVCVCVLCVCVCVFLIFLRRSTMAGNIFTQPPPPMIKLPTALSLFYYSYYLLWTYYQQLVWKVFLQKNVGRIIEKYLWSYLFNKGAECIPVDISIIKTPHQCFSIPQQIFSQTFSLFFFVVVE